MTDPTISRRRKSPRPPVAMEATLLDWAARGSTAASVDDALITVDRGIPGEQVVAMVDRRRRPWRGVVDEVLRPSPHRAESPCPYFLRGCGGCQWQHVRYEVQLETKRELVDREMGRGGVSARVGAVHAMSEPWRYRRTAALALGWEAGFRPRGRRGIVEVHDCLISHPLIGHLADQANDALRGGRLPNYHGKVWLDCTVVGSEADPGLQVLIQGIEGLTLETHPELPDVARTLAGLDGVRSVAFRHRSGEPRPLVGDLVSLVEVGGRAMHLPAGSFFQTNLAMLPQVIGRMAEALNGRTVRGAADVYGGVGTLGLPLAHVVETMTLVELDPRSVEAARRTAREWQLDNVRFVSRHAERALPLLPALDLVIVDPPRSGLGETVVETLAVNRPSLVLYLSCSPSSQARDLAALQARGYRVRSLEIFDFYPQTYHVESLAVLSYEP